MMEFIMTMGKKFRDLMKWLGIHEIPLFKAASEKLAARFSSYARRWLIVFFFITFTLLAGGWKNALLDVYHYYREANHQSNIAAVTSAQSLTNLISNAHFESTNNSALVNIQTGRQVSNQNETNKFESEGSSPTSHEKVPIHVFIINHWLVLASFVVWLTLAVIISLLITTIVDGVVSRETTRLAVEAEKCVPETWQSAMPINQGAPTAEQEMKKLATLLKISGIQEVYPATTGISALNQQYANEIKSSVAKASRVRLMTIAGFEYIGRGKDSLLFEAIKDNAKVELEVVLLDWVKGADTIEERVQMLKVRDETYNSEKLIGEIKATQKTLKTLVRQYHRKIDFWIYMYHPAFRFLIVDDCIYLSTYTDKHGHESPVFKIVKNGAQHQEGSSWYESVVKLFENAKLLAQKKDL